MTDLRTAAQQALEALDKSLYMNDYCGLEVSKHDQPDVTNAIENLRAALAEPQEPVAVTVEAVAEVIEKDGEPELCWLIEGGIYALAEGDILMIAHRSITGDDGSGEVYTSPPKRKENT